MRAILLVAGVGRRLGKPDQPKSMLDIGGKTLIERHLDALGRAGVSALTVVVGHLHEQIEREVERLAPTMPVRFRFNEHYREGSVVSLFTAREDLSESEATVVMDGDVLYEHQLLVRQREGGPGGGGEAASAFLVDVRSDETGEEMMVGVRGGLARRIARRVGKGDERGPWDMVGESVGFLKIGKHHAAPMRAALEAHVAAGKRGTEYEAVYDTFLDAHEVGVVAVGDSPWTEIDFEEDVTRARNEILPAILARASS